MAEKNFAEDQAEFMDLCEQPRYTLTQTLDALNARDKEAIDRIAMYQRLIDEEVHELRGHFFDMIINPVHHMTKSFAASEEINVQTLVELADDCIDILYVTCGLMNTMGMPVQELWNEVQRSNMAKGVDGKVLKRDDGKVLKPKGWKPPDLNRIIRNVICAEHAKTLTHKRRTDPKD